jgi:hypothetical protein
MIERKLKSGVNWQVAAKQKGVKEMGVQGLGLLQDRKYT